MCIYIYIYFCMRYFLKHEWFGLVDVGTHEALSWSCQLGNTPGFPRSPTKLRCGSAEQPGLLPRLLDDLFSIKAREHWRSEIHFAAWSIWEQTL